MSKEVMQQALELNKYFTSLNGVDVPDRVSIPRDEWRAFFEALAAPQPAQPAQPERDSWVDDLPAESMIDALAEIRDLFPAPKQGGHGEHEWASAIGDPLCVPHYVKTMLAAPQPAAVQPPVAQPALAQPAQPAKPLTHEQRIDLLAKFEAHKHEWHAPSILIDMVEAAHGIKEQP